MHEMREELDDLAFANFIPKPTKWSVGGSNRWPTATDCDLGNRKAAHQEMADRGIEAVVKGGQARLFDLAQMERSRSLRAALRHLRFRVV